MHSCGKKPKCTVKMNSKQTKNPLNINKIESHELRCWRTKSSHLHSDAIDDPSVSYTAAVVEADDSGSEQVPVENSDMVAQQHVALVTQEDGTQQQVTECSDITNCK